jgi:tetratricopeptide (TPR) repeat protein
VTSIQQALQTAGVHLQRGEWQQAEQVCLEILKLDPDQVEALHRLAAIAAQTGRGDRAIEYLRAVLRRQPGSVAAHNNLANVLAMQGRLAEAEAGFRDAIRLKPDYAEAHNNLANVLRDQGALDEAVAAYRRALELKPSYAEAHNNLGVTFAGQGRSAEAISCYRRALELKPDFVGALVNLASGLAQDVGRLDEVIACYRQVLELNPDLVEAHHSLGNVLKEQGKFDEAVTCYCRALELNPEHIEAYNNLGVALEERGEPQEAAACYRRALELNPDYPEAYNNLGNLFLENAGNLDEAVGCYNRALAIRPDFADAHCNRAIAWLLAGDWRRGWPEYEWRWQLAGNAPRRFSQPAWEGEPLAGKTILLYAEQGLGDTIQFVRYAPLVEQRGGRVVLLCPRSLAGLLGRCSGVKQVVDEDVPRVESGDDALPPFDAHAPLVSLPRLFDTTPESVPGSVPYLSADPQLAARWREDLAGAAELKVGIAWQGSRANRRDRSRSIPLARFAPLAGLPGVRLYSLQKGDDQLTRVPFGRQIVDLDKRLSSFSDTAAIIENLDLVISCDTSVGHLAGALGRPVWLGLASVPDWRWLLAGHETCWYPTMRLFRQRSAGDWEGVFEEIERALRALVESRR